MTKEEYGDFVLRYKGCGACFPMYHTLSRFEKMWFSAIQKDVADLEKENAVLKRRIERAKECMKKLLFMINSDPANYNCKGLVQDAEDFIHNRTCNIRQKGQHCISETRCIMCDR